MTSSQIKLARRSPRCGWGALALLWWMPAPALAQQETPLVVAIPGTPSAAVEVAVVAAIAAGGERVTLRRVLAPEAPPPVADPDTALAEAERALQSLDLVRAEAAFARAEAALALQGMSQRPLVDFFLVGARLRLLAGDNAAYQAELARAAVVEGHAAPDPVQYPPKLRKAFALAQEAARSGPQAELVVGVPAGAALYLDGKPAEGRSLLPVGAHWVRVEAPGHLPFATVISLAATGAQVEVMLTEDVHARYQERVLKLQDSLAALSGWEVLFGASEVLVLREKEGAISFTRATPRGSTIAEESLARWDAAAVGAAIQRLYPAPVSQPATVPGPFSIEEPAVTPPWRRANVLVPAGLLVFGALAFFAVDLWVKEEGVVPSVELQRPQ